jgi:hypothetical protein
MHALVNPPEAKADPVVLFSDGFESGAGQWPTPGNMVIGPPGSVGANSMTFSQVSFGPDAQSTMLTVDPAKIYRFELDYMTKGGGGFIGFNYYDANGNSLGTEWLMGDGGSNTQIIWDYNVGNLDASLLNVWKH